MGSIRSSQWTGGPCIQVIFKTNFAVILSGFQDGTSIYPMQDLPSDGHHVPPPKPDSGTTTTTQAVHQSVRCEVKITSLLKLE